MKESDLDTVVKDPRLTAKAVGASTNVFICFQLQPVSMRSSTPLQLSAHAMIFRTNNIPISSVDYFSLIIVAVSVVFHRGSTLIRSDRRYASLRGMSVYKKTRNLMNFSLKDATMIKYSQEDHLVPVYRRSDVSMGQEDYTDDVSRSQEDVDDPTETKLILKDKSVEDDKMTADDLTTDPEKAKEVEEAHPELTEEVEEEEASDTDAIGDASSDSGSSDDDNNDSDSDLSVDDDIQIKESNDSKDNKDDSSKHEETHEESSETTTSSDGSSTTTVSSSSTTSTESYYHTEASLIMEVLLRKPDISLESYRHIETSLNYLESRLFKDYVPVVSVEERTENRVKLINRAMKVLNELPFKARMPVHRPVFSLEDFMLEDSHYAIIDPSKDIPSQITTQIDILESRDQPKLFKVGHEIIKDDSTCDCALKERVYHALESLQDLTPIQGKVLSILHHYVIHKAI